MYDEKIKTLDNIDTFNKYPFMFHKYLLNLSNQHDEIKYTIIKENTMSINTNSFFSHLHCYDIDRFEEIYEMYIDRIMNKFSVIVTYCIGTNIPHQNITLLMGPNKGMDIGGKFICVDYLNKRHINYEYILFLHSKSDPEKRKIYFDPLVDNLDDIFKTINDNNNNDNNNNENIGAYVPPLVHYSYYYIIKCDAITKIKFTDKPHVNNKNKWHLRNATCMHELIDYFDLDKKNIMFPEGNCYILKKEIINALYGSKLIYNTLNHPSSFDASWTQLYCKLYEYSIGDNIYDIFKYFKNTNNIDILTQNINIRRDGMIEYCFERLIFLFLQKLKLKVKILPMNKTDSGQIEKITYLLNEYLNDEKYIHYFT